MFNTIVGAGAVGAALRYGSDQKMRLRLRNTVINCYILCHFKFLTMMNTIAGAGAVGAGPHRVTALAK
jgi:hypothetical protein